MGNSARERRDALRAKGYKGLYKLRAAEIHALYEKITGRRSQATARIGERCDVDANCYTRYCKVNMCTSKARRKAPTPPDLSPTKAKPRPKHVPPPHHLNSPPMTLSLREPRVPSEPMVMIQESRNIHDFSWYDDRTSQKTLEYWSKLLSFDVNTAKLIGKGTFNKVFRAMDLRNKKWVAFRLSAIGGTNELWGEDVLSRYMAAEDIGIPVLRSALVHNGRGNAILGLISVLADGSLHNTLNKRASDPLSLASSLARRIFETCQKGIMLADIKPDNILTVGGQAYLTDFDPVFISKDYRFERVCKHVAPSRVCAVADRDRGIINHLFGRLMVWQLLRFMATWGPSGSGARRFARALATDPYTLRMFSGKDPKKVRVAGKEVSFFLFLNLMLPDPELPYDYIYERYMHRSPGANKGFLRAFADFAGLGAPGPLLPSNLSL